MNMHSLGHGSTDQFLKREYASLDLNDKRLEKRALLIFEKLQLNPTICVRRLFLNQQEARQTYDFFSNSKVTGKTLIDPHYNKTIERVKASTAKYILALNDRTILNYSSHKAKTDLGRIGKGSRGTIQTGLIQHSSLLVTDTNESLGLIDLQFFHHDENDVAIPHKNRPIEQKESFSWVKALRNMRQRLKDFSKKVITVTDREGDFYEFLHELVSNEESFVIRACHNRYTGENHRSRQDKLFDQFDKIDAFEEIVTHYVYNPNNHKRTEETFKIKKIENVQIPTTEHITYGDDKKYTSIFINAINVYNEKYNWIILTNLSVTNFEESKEVINIYKARWHIEDYHKILKTAYQIDEIYLHSSRQAIENALTMAAISACRLYWIIYIGRVEKQALATILFKNFEWKSLYVYFKKKIPNQVPLLSEIIIKIAQLGGYKKTKTGYPPGIKTIWIGFQAFYHIAEMYKNMTIGYDEKNITLY